MKAKFKKILYGIGIFIFLPVFLWFLLGAGIPVTKDLLGIGSSEDMSHRLYMTDDQMKELTAPEH